MSAATLLCLAVWVAAEDLSQVKEVGPVKVTTSLTPSEPVIGDEIHFEIRVESEPHVEVLMPEFGEALDRYTILDFVSAREIDDDQRSRFTQRYSLQPDSSGAQSIPPILVEFVDNRPGQTPTPEDMDAYEILTDRIDFSVQSVLTEDATKELKPPLGELQLESESQSSPGLWMVGALLVAVLAGSVGVVAWRRWRRHVSRRNAYEIARGRLDQLLLQPTTNDQEVGRFFVIISGIVRRYLEDRFELRAPDFTTEAFLELAGSAIDLSHDHQALLRRFLRQADLVKFAGVTASPDDIRHSADMDTRFLEETRENAPWVDDVAAARGPDRRASEASRSRLPRSAAPRPRSLLKK